MAAVNSKDLTNQKYHNLFIVSIHTQASKENNWTKYWNCICDCGKACVKNQRTIIKGHTKSCGCLQKQAGQKRFLGFEAINKTYFNIVKRGALERGFEFNITIEQMWEQFIKQNKKCALTGLDLKFGNTNRGIKKTETTASLDRIDSSKGYTADNIQWLHKDINIMKKDHDEKYFVELCNLVAKRQP